MHETQTIEVERLPHWKMMAALVCAIVGPRLLADVLSGSALTALGTVLLVGGVSGAWRAKRGTWRHWSDVTMFAGLVLILRLLPTVWAAVIASVLVGSFVVLLLALRVRRRGAPQVEVVYVGDADERFPARWVYEAVAKFAFPALVLGLVAGLVVLAVRLGD